MHKHSRLFIFTTLVLLLLHVNCAEKNNPVNPDNKLFFGEYWFINQSDPNIRAVEILSLTHYPREQYTIDRLHNFQRPAILDTLKDTVDVKIYPGCTMQLGVYVNKYWDSDSIPCWRFYYFAKVDTVNSASDRIKIFRWPQDTARAVHQYVNQIGFCRPKTDAVQSDSLARKGDSGYSAMNRGLLPR